MVSQDSLLVTLVKLVDRLPVPLQPSKRGRGHPIMYTDRLFLKALVMMIVRHLHHDPASLRWGVASEASGERGGSPYLNWPTSCATSMLQS